MAVPDTAATLIGLTNDNEFFSAHCLAEVFQGDFTDTINEREAREDAAKAIVQSGVERDLTEEMVAGGTLPLPRPTEPCATSIRAISPCATSSKPSVAPLNASACSGSSSKTWAYPTSWKTAPLPPIPNCSYSAPCPATQPKHGAVPGSILKAGPGRDHRVAWAIFGGQAE